MNADGQGPDGCLALFLHQRALQNPAAPLGHTKRYDSPPFPSEILIFPSTENQTKGGGDFCGADSSALFPGSVFALYSRAEGERTRGWTRTFGVFPLPSAVSFYLECKAELSPRRGSPGATPAPRRHWAVTSWLTGELW